MDHLYAVGVSCIEFVQYWFKDSKDYLELVNDLSNPHYALEYIFPLVSAVDSVFGSQFLLSMAFGGWVNSILKWWLLEDRPYWWVRETNYYNGNRPKLHQYRQTCETGPGSPSGHSTNIAMCLVLAIMWIQHVINDRKLNLWWWKYLVYPTFAFALGSVMLARLFVATHFPHQCVLGALIGSIISPALCIYATDPYIWGERASTRSASDVLWHAMSAIVAILIAFVTYWSLKLCGVDPQWSVKLAFRWCQEPDNIHVSTTPLYALAQSTGSLLGFAISFTPKVAEYRHYTKNRSLVVAFSATALLLYLVRELQENVNRDKAWCFYLLTFIIYCIKPILFIVFVPWLAKWPYQGRKIKKD